MLANSPYSSDSEYPSPECSDMENKKPNNFLLQNETENIKSNNLLNEKHIDSVKNKKLLEIGIQKNKSYSEELQKIICIALREHSCADVYRFNTVLYVFLSPLL